VRRLGAALALTGVLAAGCGGTEERASIKAADKPSATRAAPSSATTKDGKATTVVPPGDVDTEEAQAIRAQVETMIARVAKARGLPVRHKVPLRILDRAAMLKRIRAQAERDLPMDELAYQGEFLNAFGLIPPEYDFVAGMFALIEGQIAGFYVPEDGTMYLVDDLSEAEAEETLAHELVHALQDQTYAIGAMIKFDKGATDRVTAAHALIEGDATSAMLDVSLGSAFAVDESLLRRILAISTAISTAGAATPRVLQSSLTAPYADGFVLVQELRRRGGWKAVDAAYGALPATTEQLLHIDKYDAREPAIPVAVPSIAALGEGYREVLDDMMGEQGLRIVLEEWAHRTVAKAGAAGWGGDRFVVARRDIAGSPDRRELASAWHITLDTLEDAREVVDLLAARHGSKCVERASTGPLVWKARGRDIVLTAGPYERRAKEAKATTPNACAVATKWAEAILQGGGTAQSGAEHPGATPVQPGTAAAGRR
jgi:hypothetical protein